MLNLSRLLRPGIGQLGTYSPRPLSYENAKPRFAKVALNPPKISIVIPSYNQGKYLEHTLRSIIDQNYPNLEIFVVDAGSTDETLTVIRRYESVITGWVSEPDGGQTAAINKGFRWTTGEIMAWINSDDLVAKGALHLVAAHFLAHPDTDVVYGDRILIDENGHEIGRWIVPFHSERVMKWADFIPQETLYWRRSAWDLTGQSLDEGFRFAMDWDFLLRLVNANMKFAHIPSFLGLFRVHRSQKTSTQIASVGALEMRRLRIRELGREVSSKEVVANIVPFLLLSRLLEILAWGGKFLHRRNRWRKSRFL